MNRLPRRAALWSRRISRHGAYIRYPKPLDFAIMAPIEGIGGDYRATRIAITLVPNGARAPRAKAPQWVRNRIGCIAFELADGLQRLTFRSRLQGGSNRMTSKTGRYFAIVLAGALCLGLWPADGAAQSSAWQETQPS